MSRRRWLWSGVATALVVPLTIVLWPPTSDSGADEQSQPIATTTDLLEFAADGHWTSAAGEITFGDLSEKEHGSAQIVDGQRLVDETTVRALKTHPNYAVDGFVDGTLSLPHPVRAGEHFVASLGFYLDRPECDEGYVEFTAYVLFPSGSSGELLRTSLAAAVGQPRKFDLDLTTFEGATGIRLHVDALGDPTCDWAAWWDLAIVTYT